MEIIILFVKGSPEHLWLRVKETYNEKQNEYKTLSAELGNSRQAHTENGSMLVVNVYPQALLDTFCGLRSHCWFGAVQEPRQNL